MLTALHSAVRQLGKAVVDVPCKYTVMQLTCAYYIYVVGEDINLYYASVTDA